MRERGGREAKIKAELNSLMWLLCSSQLLLQGLLHLHFSLKIAPVIIYLAGARHPALCFQRMVLPLSEAHGKSDSILLTAADTLPFTCSSFELVFLQI